MSTPTVNVLYTPGTNSHKETMWAFERVGAKAQLLFLNEVLEGKRQLDDADALCIPGGFSYGDHIGAGAVAGQFLRTRLADQLQRARRKPVIAICNGFQIAVRSGLFGEGIALTVNENGTFRNRVRQLHLVEDTNCVWLTGLQGATLRFPCAHGEGKFVYDDRKTGVYDDQRTGVSDDRKTGVYDDRKTGMHDGKSDDWQVALRYPEGANPDGSTEDIGAIASSDGLLFGLMNHPERLLDEPGNLDIFANGIKAIA